MSKPEILVLSWIPPSFKNGGGIRIHYLLRELCRTYRVVLLYPDLYGDKDVDLPDGSITCAPVSGRLRDDGAPKSAVAKLFGQDPAFATRYRLADCASRIEELIQSHSFVGIQVFQVHMMLNMPASAYSLPVHLDLFDILSSIARRDVGRSKSLIEKIKSVIRYRKVKAWEKRVLGRAAFISVVSDVDGAVVREWHSSISCALVPNGADVARMQEPPATGRLEKKPYNMIFVGSFGYGPNLEGILYFIEHVLPRIRRSHPVASLTVAGSSVPSNLRRLAEQSSVTIVDSPDDMRPYLQQAAVSVVPIFNGGGTRIKILEAAACGAAVVATPVGAEGIDMKDGEHFLVRDMPDPFAEAVCRLFDDDSMRVDMCHRALSIVQQRYDWSVVAQPLVTSWEQVRP